MSELAIRAEHLSKRYKIGLTGHQNTLRDQLMASAKALFRRNGRLHAGNGIIWALQDVSFEVKRGEIVGIIGRNGAGKSTLLKILSRITRPTKGRAEIWGRVGSLLEVGTGFHSELSGRENLYLSGAILGMRRAEIDRKFEEIVAFAEIDDFIDTPVKHYSSGMYMRLAFAVAAHLDPDILLIDEVLSVGDLAFQRKCLEHAKRLQEGDATVLFVSHNMFAIKALCHRVIYIANGQVHFDGPPEEAIELYEKDSRLSTAPWAQGTVGADPSQRPIMVTEVELLDEDGEPRRVFDYGERMRVRLRFEATRRVVHPNFNVSFMRSDNVACCNYNTSMDGFMIPSVSGQGSIEVFTPPLKLVSELYAVHVMVWDDKFERLHSAQVGTTFHVRHQQLSKHFGVFHEAAEWRWQPDGCEGSETAKGQPGSTLHGLSQEVCACTSRASIKR
jgi:lipopolysaccharide transport system ATP-binding protein